MPDQQMEKKKIFSWQIDNFSKKNDILMSDSYFIDGSQWRLCVYPKGKDVDGYMSVFLFVDNPEKLPTGWRIETSCRFVLLDQSRKELQTTAEEYRLFCAEAPGWGYHRMFLLSKLLREGFLENDKLNIEVNIKVINVVNEGKSTENELVAIHDFYVLNHQVILVSNIIAQHPDFAVNVKSNIREVKTAYMNILLNLIEILNKPPQVLSKTELSNIVNDFNELTEAGFKLDWLKPKLEDISLKTKKLVSDDSTVQKLEDNSDLKIELSKENTESVAAKFCLDELMDWFVKRFFLSCFSISSH